MTRDEFDAFCANLKGTSHVVQWGGASVWKVGGKIFAIAPNVAEGEFQTLSFKVSDFAYEVLSQQDGLDPAPYLARAKWIQLGKEGAMNDDDLKSHLTEAHQLIAAKLTKKVRLDLGL